MKIEITDEMQQVLGFRDDATAQLHAVLAIVNRDYIVQKRCPEQLSPDIRCDLAMPDGMAHVEMHQCRLTDLTEGTMESVVTWR